jgi:L-alanine-DL-glutamate epimerase-like enolase superfamily enzyme
VSGARLRWTPFRLPLCAPIATGTAVLAAREGALVRLERADGAVGFGEATPAPGFAGPAAFAAAARDCAARDAAARTAGRSLAAALALALGTRPRAHVRVNALVAAADLDAAVGEARRAAAAGFGSVKLKLRGAALARDLERVAAVRKAVPEVVRVRVDANASLGRADAAAVARALADLGVEHLEQPLPTDDLAGLAALRALGAVPIAADESAATLAGALRVLEVGAADVLVVKPSVLGLGGALALARRACAAGAGLVVTSALDGAIARAAALHLAAALPDPLPDCGLATAGLLADDLAPEPPVEDGALRVPAGPGLGVAPDPAALARLRCGPDREEPA